MWRTALAMLIGSAFPTHAAVVVAPPPQKELKAVADRLHSTVIAIRSRATLLLADGSAVDESNYGTGVLVGDGLAVTTLHTVGEMGSSGLSASSDIQAIIPERGSVRGEIVAWFPELDLAILRLEGVASLQAPPLASTAPAPGEALVAMGVDEEAVRVLGVTVAAADDDRLVLTSSRRVDSRFWGGPLFDARGRLVGISLPTLNHPNALGSIAFHGLLERLEQHERAAAGPDR